MEVVSFHLYVCFRDATRCQVSAAISFPQQGILIAPHCWFLCLLVLFCFCSDSKKKTFPSSHSQAGVLVLTSVFNSKEQSYNFHLYQGKLLHIKLKLNILKACHTTEKDSNIYLNKLLALFQKVIITTLRIQEIITTILKLVNIIYHQIAQFT